MNFHKHYKRRWKGRWKDKKGLNDKDSKTRTTGRKVKHHSIQLPGRMIRVEKDKKNRETIMWSPVFSASHLVLKHEVHLLHSLFLHNSSNETINCLIPCPLIIIIWQKIQTTKLLFPFPVSHRHRNTKALDDVSSSIFYFFSPRIPYLRYLLEPYEKHQVDSDVWESLQVNIHFLMMILRWYLEMYTWVCIYLRRELLLLQFLWKELE